MSAKSALDILMNKKPGAPDRNRFPCPAGCGEHVTERDVNDHLDRCLAMASSDAGNEEVRKGDRDDASGSSSRGETTTKRRRTTPSSADKRRRLDDAFAHMMQRSSSVFSKSRDGEKVVRRRFHLHDEEGLVTWTSEGNGDDGDDGCTEKGGGGVVGSEHPESKSGCSIPPIEVNWSATTTVPAKRMNVIEVAGANGGRPTPNVNDGKALELTISSSLDPFRGDPPQRLVRRHSRLSVSQLKSCLQKSVRRRAPLPAVRVAMELADKAWGDLIRRLPIIVLEDSTLHPDFGLLVWLMAAESKGYRPCMPVLRRVLQIVFEIASCPRQDALCSIESTGAPTKSELSLSLSLTSSTEHLFPEGQSNFCEVVIRSMLLRAQYGGMKCDVQMLHGFAVEWLKRFGSSDNVPSSCTLESAARWWDVPEILHRVARERSRSLVSPAIACPGGLIQLNLGDVCPAGIDFHCSPVVEHLISRRDVRAALCERLARPQAQRDATGTDWITGQVKSMM